MGEISKTVARKPDVKKENSVSQSQRTLSSHSGNPSINHILFLQRTVGNHAVQKLIKSGRLQANLKISQPGDIYEQQAEKVAEQVVSPASTTQATSITELPGDGKQVQLKEGASGEFFSDSVIHNPGQGQPINTSTRNTLESHLGADLSNVRVHDDSSAHEATSALNAKAFTHGNNIWLGKGESQNNLRLMAHEATHVVQQGHSISKMPVGNKTSTPALAVRHTNGDVVQRSIFSPLKNLVENQIEDQIWEQLNKYAPELVQIIKKGIFVWLEEKITSVVDNLFNTLMAPVRSLTGIVQSVNKHFTSLLTWMQEAAVKISKGDCSSISEAAEKIGKVIDGLASPIIDKVKNLAKKVGIFFTGLWDRFGAPAWDFLKSAGGAAWEKIQQLGKMIWDKTAPVRKVFNRAWGWIKNKLGIGEETEGQNKQGKGEETEGQNGILQWVKRKASDLWDKKIKPFIIRFKKPLIVVVGVLVMLSPAGPLVAIGAGAVGLVKGIRWISQHMKKPQNVAQQQGALKEVILPGLMGAVNSVKAALRKAAILVTNSLNKVIEGLTQVLSAVSGSILNFVAGALQWITDQFQGLVAWANEKLTSLVDVISSGLEMLNEFLYPIFGVLEKIGDVVSDIMNLSSLVLGKLWNMIPACIRNPLINFLINQILKNIPILGDVIELVPTLWSEIKVTALTIIKKVFKDGDLIGAAFEIFKLVLRVLNIPMELLVSVIAKAGSAIDHVIKKPFVFLGNLLKAIKNGFIQFGKNILSHLLSGLKNWLFGAVAGLGIHLPEDLSIKSIFNFILEVLDITVEKVLVRLEKKFGPGKIAPVRKAIRVISQVWDWISTLLEEGPQGVWNKLKEKLGDLWSTLIGEISTWITVNVVVNAITRLATTLAGGPVGPVVQGLISLYKAIQSVMRYARQLLEIVDLVLDNVKTIVSGSIGTAATKVEDALERSLTVALGFLANQVGLGNLEKKVSKIMESIRNKIIDGIDWLISKALKVGGALIGMVKGKGKKGAASNDPKALKDTRVVVMLDLNKDGKAEQHTLRFEGMGTNAKHFINGKAEQHNLRFEGMGTNAKHFINSENSQPLEAFVNAHQNSFKNKDALKQLRKKMAKVRTLQRNGIKDPQTIKRLLTDIAKILSSELNSLDIFITLTLSILKEEEPLQGKFESIQRYEIPEEEPLHTKRENNTRMPDNLKAGVESLSGIDMSDVRVHYNSSKPAKVGALAYTQGTNIYIASGQERHLSHEAWHVVQQKQGRVKPTMQLKDVAVNDNRTLEAEADLMGQKVLHMCSWVETPKGAKNNIVDNSVFQKKDSNDLSFGSIDKRSKTITQSKLQNRVDYCSNPYKNDHVRKIFNRGSKEILQMYKEIDQTKTSFARISDDETLALPMDSNLGSKNLYGDASFSVIENANAKLENSPISLEWGDDTKKFAVSELYSITEEGKRKKNTIKKVSLKRIKPKHKEHGQDADMELLKDCGENTCEVIGGKEGAVYAHYKYLGSSLSTDTESPLVTIAEIFKIHFPEKKKDIDSLITKHKKDESDSSYQELDDLLSKIFKDLKKPEKDKFMRDAELGKYAKPDIGEGVVIVGLGKTRKKAKKTWKFHMAPAVIKSHSSSDYVTLENFNTDGPDRNQQWSFNMYGDENGKTIHEDQTEGDSGEFGENPMTVVVKRVT